uniref:Integrin alpha-7-like n=1 Tax=Callorhinchus milii TaxID=7868 RepID=A0A4W3H878_CALMI
FRSYIVLVGAPLAKGLTHQLANRTGGLFNCPIITEDDKCDQVDIDNEGSTISFTAKFPSIETQEQEEAIQPLESVPPFC